MKNNAQEIWGKTVTPRKWRRAVDSVFRHDPSISSTLDNYVRKGANLFWLQQSGRCGVLLQHKCQEGLSIFSLNLGKLFFSSCLKVLSNPFT